MERARPEVVAPEQEEAREGPEAEAGWRAAKQVLDLGVSVYVPPVELPHLIRQDSPVTRWSVPAVASQW